MTVSSLNTLRVLPPSFVVLRPDNWVQFAAFPAKIFVIKQGQNIHTSGAIDHQRREYRQSK